MSTVFSLIILLSVDRSSILRSNLNKASRPFQFFFKKVITTNILHHYYTYYYDDSCIDTTYLYKPCNQSCSYLHKCSIYQSNSHDKRFLLLTMHGVDELARRSTYKHPLIFCDRSPIPTFGLKLYCVTSSVFVDFITITP